MGGEARERGLGWRSPPGKGHSAGWAGYGPATSAGCLIADVRPLPWPVTRAPDRRDLWGPSAERNPLNCLLPHLADTLSPPESRVLKIQTRQPAGPALGPSTCSQPESHSPSPSLARRPTDLQLGWASGEDSEAERSGCCQPWRLSGSRKTGEGTELEFSVCEPRPLQAGTVAEPDAQCCCQGHRGPESDLVSTLYQLADLKRLP